MGSDPNSLQGQIPYGAWPYAPGPGTPLAEPRSDPNRRRAAGTLAVIFGQEKSMKIKILSMVIALAFVAGCTNTMRGAGQDIERGGEKIQQKAG